MFLVTYGYCALGVAISVLLPILQQVPARLKQGPWTWAQSQQETPRIIALALVTGVISLLAAVILVAAVGEMLTDWKAAVLVGYAWDSTLQRLIPQKVIDQSLPGPPQRIKKVTKHPY